MSNNDIDKMLGDLAKNDNQKKYARKKRIKFFLKIFLIILLLSTIAGMTFYLSSKKMESEFEDRTGLPDWLTSRKDVEKENEEKEEVNLEGKYPIEIYEWAKNPFDPKEFWAQEGIYDEIYKTIQKDAYAIITAAAWMPASKGDGVNDYIPKTNDVNEKLLDDGFPNPNFSYTLNEDYYKTFMVTIERILNPEFGDWDKDGQFSDIIDKKWLDKNKNKSLTLEWSEKLESEHNLPELYDNRFFGKINKKKQIEIRDSGHDSQRQPILDVDVPVEFFAFDTKGETVILEGNLKFKLLSNEDSSNVNNRVIVKDVEITTKSNLVKSNED